MALGGEGSGTNIINIYEGGLVCEWDRQGSVVGGLACEGIWMERVIRLVVGGGAEVQKCEGLGRGGVRASILIFDWGWGALDLGMPIGDAGLVV